MNINRQRIFWEGIPPNRKIVVEKWCYFPQLYKMTDFIDKRFKKVKKGKFPLRFSSENSKFFLENVSKREKFTASFLNFF